MSQETLELLVWVLGSVYLVTIITLYLLYHFSWKKIIKHHNELNTRMQSSINKGILAEEHARNLIKSMRKTIDIYEKAICKEDTNPPVDK